MNKFLPDVVARTRKSICRCNCDINFLDPCAVCPKKKWKEMFCEKLETNNKLQTFPSPINMAKNFVSSVGKEVKLRINGGSKLTEKESSIRFSICESCEFFHKPSQRCKKCGCFLKWKTAWRSQKCPIGKW
jgi:hypothetical protein